MMSRRLAIDVDGVLANFTDSYGKLLTAESGLEFPKCSEEFPKLWYWEREAGVTPEQEKKVWETGILHEGSTFWQELAPMPEAKTTLRQLNRLAREGHEVFFLTHRMGWRAKSQTEKWLYKYGVDYPTVLLSGNKFPLIDALGVDFFIDDKPDTVKDVDYRMRVLGLPLKLYMKKAAYNKEYWEKFNSVDTVEEALKLENLWEE